MKHQSPFRLLATLVLATAPSLLAGTIAYSQNPDPFKALEGTSGNIAFVTLTNNDPFSIAYITSKMTTSAAATTASRLSVAKWPKPKRSA